MKLSPSIILVVFCFTIFSSAEVPKSIEGLVAVDMTIAMGMSFPPSEEDGKKRDVAVTEALTLIELSPGATSEFEALGENETKGTPVSAVILQDIISDYEALKIKDPVSPLITYYIAKSKVKVLSPRQRVIAFLMIKSVIKQYKAKTK